MKQGNLTEVPAVALVRDLMQENASGLLELCQERVTVKLCLRDGSVVYALTNLKKFQLPVWLEQAGVAPAARVEAAAAGRSGSAGVIDGLIQAGTGSRPVLIRAVRRCVRAIALHGLAWTTGSFEFRPGTPVLKHEVTLEDSTRSLLLQAAAALPDELRAAIRDSLDSGTGGSSSPGAAGARPAASVADPVLDDILTRTRSLDDATLYELLGVAPDASPDEIRSSYYRLARRFHPDSLRGEEADAHRDSIEAYFAAVTEAYNRLRHREERAAYDQEMKAGQRQDDGARADPAALARQNYEQGRRALAAGKLHDASQFLSNAVRIDPDRAEYHRDLGIVQMKNPRWQKAAEQSLRNAVEMAPTDVQALVHLGLLYKNNGLTRRADDLFRRALQWDPDNRIALRERTGTDEDASDGGLLKGIFGRR